MSSAQEQASPVARLRAMLVSRYDDGEWREQALCRDVDTEVFFPIGSGPRAMEVADVAKAICATCPVQVQCLRFAVATNQQYGIWGGCDEEERRMIRRRLRSERSAAGAGGPVEPHQAAS